MLAVVASFVGGRASVYSEARRARHGLAMLPSPPAPPPYLSFAKILRIENSIPRHNGCPI